MRKGAAPRAARRAAGSLAHRRCEAPECRRRSGPPKRVRQRGCVCRWGAGAFAAVAAGNTSAWLPAIDAVNVSVVFHVAAQSLGLGSMFCLVHVYTFLREKSVLYRAFHLLGRFGHRNNECELAMRL